MAKKLYGFDESGRREYRQIRKTVLGGGKQTHVFKKWERGGFSGAGGSPIVYGTISAVAAGVVTISATGQENWQGSHDGTEIEADNTPLNCYCQVNLHAAVIKVGADWFVLAAEDITRPATGNYYRALRTGVESWQAVVECPS